MKPLAYTSPYCWLFWAVFLYCYGPEFALVRRSRPAHGERTDRGSMTVIMLAGWIGSIAAFVVAPNPRFSITHNRTVWFAVGLSLLFLGCMLRNTVGKCLGSISPE